MVSGPQLNNWITFAPSCITFNVIEVIVTSRNYYLHGLITKLYAHNKFEIVVYIWKLRKSKNVFSDELSSIVKTFPLNNFRAISFNLIQWGHEATKFKEIFVDKAIKNWYDSNNFKFYKRLEGTERSNMF